LPEIPSGELKFRFARSGGPGGQNVNKRDTQVELIFDVDASATLTEYQRDRIKRKLASRIDAEGRLRIVVSDERTQGRNRELAIDRLQKLVAGALKPDPPKRRKTRPSKAATQRRLTEKKARSDTKKQRQSWRSDD
jgi:ribosome-associated protein